jgi:uncharacterized membrane protein
MCGSGNEKAGFLKLVGRYIGLVMFGYIFAFFFFVAFCIYLFFPKDFHQQQTVWLIHPV